MTERAAIAPKRAHIHGLWAAVAPAWGEHADYTDRRHATLTAALLDAAHPEPGERVVDLAGGAGGLGLAAATRVGPTGEVVISDVVAEMTRIAGARADVRGLRNVTTRVLDLEEIDEPDDAFDVVLCRDGLQFATDPAHAVGEIGRVMRPGGRVALAVWGARERNPWLGVVLDAASAQFNRPVPPPRMPGPFALADRQGLRTFFVDAGLSDVDVAELSVPLYADSFDEWWTRTSELAGPLSALLASQPATVAAELRARAQEAAVAFETPDGLAFEGLALVATATRGREPRRRGL